ncbi:hypothetical protein [Jannaschia formosa]|uniref:hypothetical protein n=1 Tax=Jannaschia formosa TaxID=2259592 RepID=UPI000E1BA09B|nr:hypothetical protein [Jannaschia formosa]TFL16404.1 hypothetical protein DR046_19980 [Jannaschia formosa]
MPDDAPRPRDPYAIRTLEQLLTLFDGGDFAEQTLRKHRELMIDLREHLDRHGTKGCQGEVAITVRFALGNNGDVSMAAETKIKPPKTPPATAASYVDEDGGLTLFSPLMRKMQPGPRDVTDAYDPETGEVRDV